MADIDISSLKKSFEQIRDERSTHANTAMRIGNAFLSLLGYVADGMSGKYLTAESDDRIFTAMMEVDHYDCKWIRKQE